MAKPHTQLIRAGRFAATFNLIKRLGPDAYLRNLTSILEGSYQSGPLAKDLISQVI